MLIHIRISAVAYSITYFHTRPCRSMFQVPPTPKDEGPSESVFQLKQRLHTDNPEVSSSSISSREGVAAGNIHRVKNDVASETRASVDSTIVNSRKTAPAVTKAYAKDTDDTVLYSFEKISHTSKNASIDTISNVADKGQVKIFESNVSSPETIKAVQNRRYSKSIPEKAKDSNSANRRPAAEIEKAAPSENFSQSVLEIPVGETMVTEKPPSKSKRRPSNDLSETKQLSREPTLPKITESVPDSTDEDVKDSENPARKVKNNKTTVRDKNQDSFMRAKPISSTKTEPIAADTNSSKIKSTTPAASASSNNATANEAKSTSSKNSPIIPKLNIHANGTMSSGKDRVVLPQISDDSNLVHKQGPTMNRSLVSDTDSRKGAEVRNFSVTSPIADVQTDVCTIL